MSAVVHKTQEAITRRHIICVAGRLCLSRIRSFQRSSQRVARGFLNMESVRGSLLLGTAAVVCGPVRMDDKQ